MYIVAYDITEEHERRSVVRVLEGYGHGVQKSVWVCHIHGAQARRMLKALKELQLRSGFLLSWELPDSALPECIGQCPANLALEMPRVYIV